VAPAQHSRLSYGGKYDKWFVANVLLSLAVK